MPSKPPVVRLMRPLLVTLTLFIIAVRVNPIPSVHAAGAGLLISEFLANPSGTNSPFEYVELLATQTIDFSITLYSVVFSGNEPTANANGWVAGSLVTYGFAITSGVVHEGDVVYVGGSSMAPTGIKLRVINTGTTNGDGFGSPASAGVLGNGGSHADGLAIFDQPIGTLNSDSVPIDAIFFGTGTGNTVVSGGTDGYVLPHNDRYNGGFLQSTSFLAPDPGGNDRIVATGVYNLITGEFVTPRAWTVAPATDSVTAIALVPQGLLISEYMANPPGTDSPFEYVELVATRNLNFGETPYSVIWTNNGNATANGWVAGGGITYGFSITNTTVSAGDVVYVGGTSMVPTGPYLRQINTGTTAGDRFGNANSGGVLGNGGGNADSIGVFNRGINTLTDLSVPIDAIFFGTGTGSAVVSGGVDGYTLPINDRYSGGFLQSNSFLAPDPGSGDATIATGIFNPTTGAFSAARSWVNSTTTNGVTAISFTASAPSISAIPALSGVMSDPTNPGIAFTVNDPDNAANSLTVGATATTNGAVAPLANINVSCNNGNCIATVNPAGVGYSTITITATDPDSQSTSTTFNYAASAASVVPASSRFHTGASDASTAIAIDSNFMAVADDEDQTIRIYSRLNSGLPVKQFDYTAVLGLPETGREVDIEASTRIGNRIYWLGSHSNSSEGGVRPNRYRLFATDLAGTGTSTTLTYVGRYDNLRTDLLAWDSSNGHGLGANYYGLTASAAAGVIPEVEDGSGFNIEGLTIAPDGTTGYIAFRAPKVPLPTRNRALIVPITNFTALVTGNPTTGPATFGAPIELNLGGRAIRSIERNMSNEYLIIAGPAGQATGLPPADFRLYLWTGNPANAPQGTDANLTVLNTGGSFEGIVEVPDLLTENSLGASQVQLITDNGDTIWYNDGQISKDLPEVRFQKWRTDNISFIPLSVQVAEFRAESTSEGVLILWETASENDLLGFNLYRSITPTDRGEQLNGELISSQSPGGGGATYEWVDAEVNAGTTYYYTLESVDVDGTATQHGPISVTFIVPTAVAISVVQSNTSLPIVLEVLALVGLFGISLIVHRRK